MTTPSLGTVQAWFASAVMGLDGDGDAVRASEAKRWLTPGPRLDEPARLEIYRAAYVSRLVECLADDYPVLQQALGGEAFETLCREYIARHPSTGPNLNAFGRHMADLCAAREARETGVPAAFARDLARLEWAIVEVIHAPGAPPLSAEALGEVPPEGWAGARIEATPALRVVCGDYAVNAYYQATRDRKAPPIPSRCAPSPSAVAVYRSGPTVWRMDLTPPMHAVLERLRAGETLAGALEGAGVFGRRRRRR
ncbi:MAG: DNA-binding domain-containing protein, partial [Polyangiaceae bacterium]|nr:DNA-binding domain-containing protein [Polyangiaceae bacterium]